MKDLKQHFDSKHIGTHIFDDLLVFMLSVATLVLVAVEAIYDVSSATRNAIIFFDLVVSAFLYIEFFTELTLTDNKRAFFSKRWWVLIAALPVSRAAADVVSTSYLLRINYIVRLLRALLAFLTLNSLLVAFKKLNTNAQMFRLSVVLLMSILLSSGGFYIFESQVNSQVADLGDAIWWAVVTLTTVGYGDIYPITTQGRTVAFFTMLAGIGIVSLFTAEIAAHMLRSREKSGKQ